jgi:hypothetical protein
VSHDNTSAAQPACAYADDAQSRCDQPARLVVTITTADHRRQEDACSIRHARLVAQAQPPAAARITIAPIRDQFTCVDCGRQVVFRPDGVTLVDTGGQLRCRASGASHRIVHDCQAAQTLRFVAVYGAPGTGQSWECAVCGRA